MQVVWEIRSDGSYLNGEKISEVTVNRLSIMDRAFVSVKIGNNRERDTKEGSTSSESITEITIRISS